MRRSCLCSLRSLRSSKCANCSPSYGYGPSTLPGSRVVGEGNVEGENLYLPGNPTFRTSRYIARTWRAQRYWRVETADSMKEGKKCKSWLCSRNLTGIPDYRNCTVGALRLLPYSRINLPRRPHRFSRDGLAFHTTTALDIDRFQQGPMFRALRTRFDSESGRYLLGSSTYVQYETPNHSAFKY